MSEKGRIGPNAILQMIPVLDGVAGPGGALRLLHEAGVTNVPDGTEMIPEGDAVRLHQWLRATMGDQADALARDAGQGTARYILQHRIPPQAQKLLRVLPAGLAARALSAAIAKNAWTFVGSGKFRRLGPWGFEITDNPMVRGESSARCLCVWHAAVFETLYRALVHEDICCRETACCAQPGHGRCTFALGRGRGFVEKSRLP